jgi:hypothetical protein
VRGLFRLRLQAWPIQWPPIFRTDALLPSASGSILREYPPKRTRRICRAAQDCVHEFPSSRSPLADPHLKSREIRKRDTSNRGSFTQFGERQPDVPGSEHAIFRLTSSFGRVFPCATVLGIDDPHRRYAKIEIIRDPSFKAPGSVLGRKNLDTDERRVGHNSGLRAETEDSDIRNAKAGRRNLDALLGDDKNLPMLFVAKQVGVNKALQSGMIEFAHVSLLDFSVDVIDVGFVIGREILFERNRRRHDFIVFHARTDGEFQFPDSAAGTSVIRGDK